MARTGHEADAEALQIVDGVVQRMDLELAAVARAGVDLADGERAAEAAAGRLVEAVGKTLQKLIGWLGCGYGSGPAQEPLEQEPAHRSQPA